MKKIFSFLIGLFALLTLCSFDSKVVEIGTITDQTDIYTDLITLGLTPSDYITTENMGSSSYVDDYYYFDEVYLIAVGENRQQEEYTDVYLYFYNPYIDGPAQNYYFEMKINNYLFSFGYIDSNNTWSDYPSYSVPDFELEKCSYDSSRNITKVKFQYAYLADERTYSLDGITRVSDNKSFDNPFSCTYSIRQEDGHLIADFEYNSFIYITNDKLVRVFIDSNGNFGDFWNSIFSDDRDLQLSEHQFVYFYNFSSSKQIDQIISLDVEYDYSGVCLMLRDGSFVDNTATCDTGMGSSDVDTTIKHESRTLYNEIHSYDWYSSHLEFETFKTPAADRFTDDEFGYLSFTDEQKKDFSDYEHSVLISIEVPSNAHMQTVETGWWDTAYNCYHINDISNLSVTRIEFETSGVIYNSYVVDTPNDTEDTIVPNPPERLSIADWFNNIINGINSLGNGLKTFFTVLFWTAITLISLVIIGILFNLVMFVVNLFRRKS